MHQTLDAIALRGVIRGMTMEQITQAGWQLRKGKKFEDVKKAFEKGMKMGNLKSEYEIEWTALYLRGVLKKIRKPRA